MRADRSHTSVFAVSQWIMGKVMKVLWCKQTSVACQLTGYYYITRKRKRIYGWTDGSDNGDNVCVISFFLTHTHPPPNSATQTCACSVVRSLQFWKRQETGENSHLLHCWYSPPHQPLLLFSPVSIPLGPSFILPSYSISVFLSIFLLLSDLHSGVIN